MKFLNIYNQAGGIERHLLSRDRGTQWEFVSPSGKVVLLPKDYTPKLEDTGPLIIECFPAFNERPFSFITDLRKARLEYAIEAGKKKTKRKTKGSETAGDGQGLSDTKHKRVRKGAGKAGTNSNGGPKRISGAAANKAFDSALAAAGNADPGLAALMAAAFATPAPKGKGKKR